MKNKLILGILFCNFYTLNFSQTDAEKAKLKGKSAVELMDEGKIKESIKLLEEAKELDPSEIDYTYEMGYAFYLAKDYKKTIKLLESIVDNVRSSDRVYQLLGNSYDLIKKTDKAVETYKKGLDRFPNSGNLFLELGVIQLMKKDNNKALSYFETGIDKAPDFSSNYYWAAKLYLSSQEEVWGMVYGEIFMNLERNSRRTSEMSKLLYDTYKSEIKFSSDTSYSVSFSKSSRVIMKENSEEILKLPFGIGMYEPTIMIAIGVDIKSIDVNTLNTIRTNFVQVYYDNKSFKSYPVCLFEYQKMLKDAGHLDAYNHWVLMKGDEKLFEEWLEKNKDAWDAFVTYFNENKLEITEKNKFSSSQFE
jgi:tetratricopeptide (TPR) repeat protein